jgi:hypothetical protein
MPKYVTLINQHIGVERGSELDDEESKKNGAPVSVDTWTIVYTDRTYGDQIRVTFRKEARDQIVRQLTGGVILAGGDLPSA